MKRITTILLALITATAAFGQSAEREWGIGGHFGTMQYNGDRGNEMFTTDHLHAAGALSIAKYINKNFDGLLMISHGLLDYDTPGTRFETSTTNFDLLFRYKFYNGYLLKEDFLIGPFVQFGIGNAVTSADHYPFDNAIDFNFPVGAGVKFQVAEPVSVVLQSTYHYTLSDNIDNFDRTDRPGNFRDQFLTTTVGVTFNFSTTKDSDGDGVKDKLDACPDVPGTKEANGCPDKDGDGISDAADNCPELAGVAGNNGCPEIKKADLEIMQMAMKGLFFETGSATIKQESYSVLDNVAKVMGENAGYKLKIAGHTDNTGNSDNNLKLSRQRASAAMDYLTKKGVDGSRIIAQGFGDAQPVGSNDTEDGRAKNRRVEFLIVF